MASVCLYVLTTYASLPSPKSATPLRLVAISEKVPQPDNSLPSPKSASPIRFVAITQKCHTLTTRCHHSKVSHPYNSLPPPKSATPLQLVAISQKCHTLTTRCHHSKVPHPYNSLPPLKSAPPYDYLHPKAGNPQHKWWRLEDFANEIKSSFFILWKCIWWNVRRSREYHIMYFTRNNDIRNVLPWTLCYIRYYLNTRYSFCIEYPDHYSAWCSLDIILTGRTQNAEILSTNSWRDEHW